jgi:hypothetical protein
MDLGEWRAVGGAFVARVLGRGLSLAMMTVGLIIVVLAAGGGPLYRSYSLDARTAEAKMLAGSLWTALTTQALSACGTPTAVASAFSHAGLDPTGATRPARWRVAAGHSQAIQVDCRTGAISPGGEMFTLTGVASDVSTIQVRLSYSVASGPPAHLRCSSDGGASFSVC